MTFKKVSNIESEELTSINLSALPSECESLEPPGTINPPTIVDPQNYDVEDTALEINVADFTYSVVGCTDAVWDYTCTLSDGSPLPSFIEFE